MNKAIGEHVVLSEEDYETVDTFDPVIAFQFPRNFNLVLFILLLCIIVLFPVVLVVIAYIILHEAIHWLARWLVTGKAPKFGFAGINPCVYSEDYTTRDNAIAQAGAPVIVITLLIFIGLMLQVISLDTMRFLFLINVVGSITDIQLILWYLKYPSESLCGDDGKKNYIKLPKKLIET